MIVNSVMANQQQQKVTFGQRLGEKIDGMVQGFKDEFKYGMMDLEKSDGYRGWQNTTSCMGLGMVGGVLSQFSSPSATALLIGGAIGAFGTPLIVPTIDGLFGAVMGFIVS